MLDVLRRIIQAVDNAEDLDEALGIIVSRVREAMAVDVCSVYLRAGARSDYVLMATEGLRPESVGAVRLGHDEGLVGLVGTRQEPVNLDEASAHPGYRYFPETGEEHYNAFLGVPIIHYRRPLGVLVVQQSENRRFSEDEVAFLFTAAAQLAGAIIHAAHSGEVDTLAEPPGQGMGFLTGTRGATGVAVGTIVPMVPGADLASVQDRPTTDPEGEKAALHLAIQEVREELRAGRDRFKDALFDDAEVLFDAYRMMLDSASLVRETEQRIDGGLWAPAALRHTIAAHARVFDDMEDEYLRARGEDLRDVGRLILRHLLRQEGREAVEYPEGTVLVGESITVAHLAEAPLDRIVGVACTTGSAMSHVAVLATSLGIPAVMGLGDLPLGRLEGRTIVVDGYRGRVCIDPVEAVRDEYLRLQAEDQELASGLGELRDLPAATTDGHRVTLQVNTGLLADITPAQDSGGEGVGLYRTEFPFMVRQQFPGEDEQYRIYLDVLASFAPLPVTMRTLDVGGDKTLPYFPIREENPFLGWRGIRITLDHPEVFLGQIRSMLRANAGLDNLRILLPMVSRLEEVDEASALIDQACRELAEEGRNGRRPPVGVMVEVPALVYQAEALARRVDFLSVGTNDLTQYLLAVDRNNARVAGLYDNLHPAVLRALRDIVQGARHHGRPVSVCGEMAGDPAAAILLVALGIDALSMSASALPRIKWVIRSISLERARELLIRAMAMESPGAIRILLNEELVGLGLGGLVRAGKE